MIEIVNSRNWLNALGAAAFLGGAGLSWWLPGPDWIAWAGALLAMVGLGLGYRLLLPVDAVLELDERGIRWSLGDHRQQDITWERVVGLSTEGDDETCCLHLAGGTRARVPGIFLREASVRRQFFDQVEAARPGVVSDAVKVAGLLTS